jgi:4-amino-4-deoxy-L-arabinose transferase-like glycosyltransferase
VFFVITILQAAFLELHFDEAYYWLYSRHLDWGYFDHPPFVAVLIFAGTKLFGGYLGVRFFFVLLSSGSFIFLWDMVKPYRNLPLIYWLMVFSISLWMPYTFFAVPDGPLFFFTILFLWLYKKYLQKRNWGIVLALAVTTAGLIYSKYHGFLLLFFVFLSNWKLIKERKAWGLVFLSLILLVPHFLWQFENQFPTFRYHLVDSHQTGYKIDVTLNYLLGTILLTGPFLGWLFLYSAFKYKSADSWERALKFVFAGVFLFFFIVTFGGDIELHWVLIAYIPMFILAYAFIVQNERWLKPVKKIGIIGFFVFLSARIYLILGASTCPLDAVRNMTGWKDEIALLQKEAGGRPVVFSESYQKASLYAFYTGRPYTTYPLLSGFYKYSQFDLYPTEDNIQGKNVLFVSMDSTLMKDDVRHIKGNIKDWYLRDISDFNSFSMLEITADTSTFLLENKVLRIPEIMFYNPYSRTVELEKNDELQAHLQLYIRGRKKWEPVSTVELENLKINPGETVLLKNIRFNLIDSLAGTQHIYLGLQNGPFLPVHSMIEFDLRVN